MVDNPESICAGLLESLPLIYSSLNAHQANETDCKELKTKILAGGQKADKFQLQKGLICFIPRVYTRDRILG